MGWSLHAAFLGAGGGASLTGWKHHHCRRAASVSAHAAVVEVAALSG